MQQNLHVELESENSVPKKAYLSHNSFKSETDLVEETRNLLWWSHIVFTLHFCAIHLRIKIFFFLFETNLIWFTITTFIKLDFMLEFFIWKYLYVCYAFKLSGYFNVLWRLIIRNGYFSFFQSHFYNFFIFQSPFTQIHSYKTLLQIFTTLPQDCCWLFIDISKA